VSEARAGSPRDSRVAVVVVAGVGDNPRTDAAERVANGLTLWADFDPPEEHSEWYKVSDGIQPVQRFATKGPGGTYADLYEFWWADLSRFPAALRSFLAAFVGLFLAFPSIGRTALRDSDRVTEEPQPDPARSVSLARRLDFHLLGVLAWLVSVPVVVLSATLLMSVGAVVVATALPDANSVTGAIALGLYGGVLAFVGLGLLRHYEKESGRSPAFGLGILSLLAAVGICTWRLFERGIHGASVELALADTVTEFVAYPLRILWLGILAVALATAALLAVRLILAGEGGQRRARTVSAVITLGFGPLGIATLMAIFSAAVGAAGEKVGKAVTWTGPSGTPLCLAQPDDWDPQSCSGPLTAWDFGSRLLADAIYSLAWAIAVAFGAVLVLGLAALCTAFIRTSTGNRADRQAGRLTHMLGVLESSWTCALLLLAAAAATYAAGAAWLPFLPFIHPGEHGSTWGPTVAAVLGGAVTTLLLAGRLLGLSPSNLGANSLASGALRALLDKPYDIATFLREPLGSPKFGAGAGAGAPMPRKRMLERYRALMTYVERRGYERIVFVAHSQGTILTTTLLAEDVLLRGEVSLMTFGCPLRQLYLKRFPSQYGWVERLRDRATRNDFVRQVDGEWVNVAAAGDPVGRTVFRDPPEPWSSEGSRLALPEGSPKLLELLLGEGGHSSYWTAPDLYTELGRLIEPV
jgi:hypothetical protein